MVLEHWKEVSFHNLARAEYQVTSPATAEYNCIAWATGDSSRWWEPSPYSYWPSELPQEVTLENYRALFELMGYEECTTDGLESGFEKVALYVNTRNEPTHAARQLENGNWTSKLGDWEDIEHASLGGLEGTGLAYGNVAIILRREKDSSLENRDTVSD